MTYTVARVTRWHSHGHYGHDRSAARTIIVQGRYSNLQEAYAYRRRLNMGHKQQRYWVLNGKGEVV